MLKTLDKRRVNQGRITYIIALQPRFRPFQQGNYFKITQNALFLIQYVGRKMQKNANVGYMVIALLDIEFDTICRAESSGFENRKIMVQNCNEKVLIYSGNTIMYLLLTILYHLFEPLNSLYLDFFSKKSFFVVSQSSILYRGKKLGYTKPDI